jgi:hypothetical protein
MTALGYCGECRKHQHARAVTHRRTVAAIRSLAPVAVGRTTHKKTKRSTFEKCQNAKKTVETKICAAKPTTPLTPPSPHAFSADLVANHDATRQA